MVMANHARIYRKNGSISKDELDSTLDDINKKYFKSLLPIEKGPMYYIAPTKDNYQAVQLWLDEELLSFWDEELEEELSNPIKIADQYIELRHGHKHTFYWWLDSLVSNELALRLNANWEDDGVGKMTIEKEQISYKDYFNKNRSFIPWDEEIEYLKEQISEEFVNIALLDLPGKRIKYIDGL